MIHDATFERYLRTLRVLLALILCGSAAFYVVHSIHWPVMWDTSVMHYVNFLMSQGLAPYRDIVDINLPGAYFMEGLAMHLFGGGDLGWRLYDFSLLAVLIGALLVIAWPYDWFAGLFAGVLFLLIHGSQGPANAGQREQLMITLILGGYALLFVALRRRRPLLLLAVGFVLGIAASLKPTAAPLWLVLLMMAIPALRKRGDSVKLYLLYGIAGALMALSLNLVFLFHYKAFGDFVAVARRLIPYYARIGNMPRLELLKYLIFPRYYILIVLGIALTFLNRKQTDWENWERAALGLGVLFGIVSYVSQGKPFEHHAYSFLVFLLLWFALELSKALKKRNWMHPVGLVCFLAVILYQVPLFDRRIAAIQHPGREQETLTADLMRLGGTNLQRQVQCFDMVSSCYSSLDRLKLLPYTTFMGDYMFFAPRGSAAPPYYRDILWNDLHRSPPRVIVVTNMWLCNGFSFAKLDRWPELREFLETAYTLDETREFGEAGYRIYILKSSFIPAISPQAALALGDSPRAATRGISGLARSH